jgi:hypothetical protein
MFLDGDDSHQLMLIEPSRVDVLRRSIDPRWSPFVQYDQPIVTPRFGLPSVRGCTWQAHSPHRTELLSELYT